MNIGFIGLGDMGQRMATHLVNDFELGVYNRTKSKAEGLIEKGATWYSTPAELTKWADTLILMLADDDANRDVIFGSAGVASNDTKDKDGLNVINMSTITAKASKSFSEQFRDHNATWRYLEAPVSGTLPHAENKELIVLTGGEEKASLEMKSVLESMGKRVDYIGEVGKAAKFKLLVNTILASQVGILAETMNLVEQAGIDAKKFFEFINNSALGSPVMEAKGKNMLDKSYEKLFSYDYIIKDLKYSVEEFGDGTSTHLLSAILQVYEYGRDILQLSGMEPNQVDFSAIGDAYQQN